MSHDSSPILLLLFLIIPLLFQKNIQQMVTGVYFPKRSNLDRIEEKYVYEIQEKLNNRARKALNYLTPNEIIALEFKKKGL